MLTLSHYLVYLKALYNLILIFLSRIPMLNLVIFRDQQNHMPRYHLLSYNLIVMIEHMQPIIKAFTIKEQKLY